MSLQRTPLFESCRSAGGRMVPFAGWEMPVQFSGLIQEHKAVRERVGMFDISHMGVLRLEGANPKDALQRLIPSDLHRIGPGEACYSVLLNERGGIRDDLIVYDCGAIDAERGALVLVINAACADSDTAWIREQMEPAGLTVTDIKKNGVLLALQGPKAMGLLQDDRTTPPIQLGQSPCRPPTSLSGALICVIAGPERSISVLLRLR